MKIIKKDDKAYPQKLLEIKDSPDQLYVEGNIDLLNNKSVAIVGSRLATEYGKSCAKLFANELSKQGFTIISGLAVGIDATAHIFSMEEQGKTIAVLGSGFNKIFPKENLYLYKKILENNGCIISEYEPNTEKSKENFPKRNRIISGLSMGVLLVEARYGSGGAITAKLAIKQNKDLFCIPNRIDEKTGYNTNLLIKQGANLVMAPQDIIDFYEEQDIQENNLQIPKQYEEIYNLIGQLPITINEIAKTTNKQISQISEALFMLEVEGLIKSIPGNKYIRK